METSNHYLRYLIIEFLNDRSMTANEVIDEIYKHDIKNNVIRKTSWKFYVHLNKHFAVLEKENRLKHVGFKLGSTGKMEKIWKPHYPEIKWIQLPNGDICI